MCRSLVSGRRVPCPLCGDDPPGVPGVACRRGTCGCPGRMSKSWSKTHSIPRARSTRVLTAAVRPREDRGALATRPGWVVACGAALVLYPPHLSEPQSKEPRRARRLCDGRPAQPADPVQPARSRRRLMPETGEGPPAPPRFGKRRCYSIAFAGGVAARGRAARPTNAGGNCEHLQGIAGAE